MTERPCEIASQPSGWVRAVWKLRKEVDARIPGEALLALTTSPACCPEEITLRLTKPA